MVLVCHTTPILVANSTRDAEFTDRALLPRAAHGKRSTYDWRSIGPRDGRQRRVHRRGPSRQPETDGAVKRNRLERVVEVDGGFGAAKEQVPVWVQESADLFENPLL